MNSCGERDWTPHVSVIVPCFRDERGLAETLDALRRQTYPADRLELLFVDNTPEFALRDRADRFRPARLLHQPKQGSYAARNRALAEAGGDVIAFTDADCLPQSDWVARGVAALAAHRGAAMVAGHIQVVAANPARPSPAEAFELAMAFPQEAYVRNGRFGATANVFVPRAVVDAVGPFLENIASGGDQEFGHRVHAAGFPIFYSAEVVVRHPARRSLCAVLEKSDRVLRGVRELELMGRLPDKTFSRGLLRDLRPPLTTCRRIMSNSAVGDTRARVCAAGVMVIWRYHRAFCRARLMWGR